MKISKNKFKSLFINVILLIIFIILLVAYLYNSIEINIKTISIIGFFINILILFDFFLNHKTLKSAYFLFQLLSIPFLYGQLIVRDVMNIKFDHFFDLTYLISERSKILSVLLIILSQLSINLGYLLFEKKIETDKNESKESNVVLIKTGLVLVLFSIIPTFIDYFEAFNASAISGYNGKIALILTYGFGSLYSKIVPFFYIGLLCLIYGFRNKKKYSDFLFYFGIIFYISQMLFGNRGIPLLRVICLVWFYNFFVKKFKLKYIILIVIISFVGVSFLNVIRDNRETGFGQWINKGSELLVENITKNNPLLELNYEVGTTIIPIAYTIDTIPSNIDYKYGSSYLYSLLSIFRINFSSSSNDSFTSKMNVAVEITKRANVPFGGSFIQEAYANFGWFSLFFMIILGSLFSKLDYVLSRNNKDIIVILIVFLLTSILWSIRNTLSPIPREIVWYMLPTYLIYLLNKQKSFSGGGKGKV